MKAKLHELIRVGRFQGWSAEKLADEILRLLGLEGVDAQPVTPDQLAEPSAP